MLSGVVVHEALNPWWMFAGGLLAGFLLGGPLKDLLARWVRRRAKR